MTLERTYRWLLACYPWQHRQQYEDEVVGVLLDDADPRRRRPPVRDVLDLLYGALRVRIRYAATRLAGQRWRDAAAVLGLLAALALLAHAGRLTLLNLVAFIHAATTVGGHPTAFFHLDVWDYWRPAVAWAALVVSALAGWRRAAAVLAWVAAAVQAVWMAGDSLVNVWPLVLAVLAATALTVSPCSGAAILGRGRLALLAIGALLCTASSTPGFVLAPYGWLNVRWATVGNLQADWILPDNSTYLDALLLGVGYLLVALAVLAIPPILRRRVLALLVPVAATLLVTQLGFRDWSFLAWPVEQEAGRSLAQWLALVAIPLVTLAVGVAVVHRRERSPHPRTLGRAGEKL
jgi:hypothetical protein